MNSRGARCNECVPICPGVEGSKALFVCRNHQWNILMPFNFPHPKCSAGHYNYGQSFVSPWNYFWRIIIADIFYRWMRRFYVRSFYNFHLQLPSNWTFMTFRNLYTKKCMLLIKIMQGYYYNIRPAKQYMSAVFAYVKTLLLICGRQFRREKLQLQTPQTKAIILCCLCERISG